ncbi:thioredoxin domain-containing protein [Sedimenticola sp.]|uniref:thioredoxin domain-containing protein n=1 Tax=Sedimenticola sp. TaxID=1940285 RepID=UPI003D13934D
MSTNRLSECTSPYLQQHADNPVDWYPWGEEALEKARQEDKPILLSIGYSACHWCHVMAHESFEDDATAALMNQLFVNIKVDREERPDLDKVYQSAHQLLAQRPGGWPLTVFLTPDDQTPFFAGTYFPKAERHGLPPFVDILQNIANAYRQQREDIRAQNQALIRAINQLDPIATGKATALDTAPLETARQQLASGFDETYGGFGSAPKFPHPSSLEQLLRHWAATGTHDARSLYMVDFTLTRMAQGGINDQLAGGFCRYSVDDQWMIPHFEKMLYDNGPLLALYADLWQASGKPLFRETALNTAHWVMTEMQSPEGGFYASLDADSEGHEGRFYAWDRDEVRQLLSEEEYRHFSRYYGLDREANFEGRWHLHHYSDTAPLDGEMDSTPEQAAGILLQARQKLLEQRAQRVRPGRDEKVLTTWNALMIKGLARAGRLLDEPSLIASARRAVDFLRQHLWHNQHLLAAYKDGQAHLNGYLDDYANLIDALLELLQAEWDSQLLEFAISLADTLLERFEDREQGGFFFTSNDHERLIYRPKPFGDESIPSGNGIAAAALTRLGHLLGEPRYLQAAERTLHCGWEHLKQIPHAHCTLLKALDELVNPSEIIVLRGDDDALRPWIKRANRHYAPRRISFAIPTETSGLPPALSIKSATTGCTAYLCHGSHCEAPIHDYKRFDEALAGGEVSADAESQQFEGTVGSFKRFRE